MCSPSLRLDALVGDAGAHHLGQPVDIDRVHVEGLLDLGAHRVGPGFGAEDAAFQRRRARIEPGGAEPVQDRQHVARRHHDQVRLEILDQLHLPLGLPAAHRDHGAAEPLRAVMRAEAAGEQAVAVGDVDAHARPAAAGADRARHHLGPDIEVGLRVADHGRLAGRAAAGMDAGDPLARHGEHAERVLRPQVGFGGERETAEVIEACGSRRGARRRRRRRVGNAACWRKRGAGSAASRAVCSAAISSRDAVSIGSSSPGRGDEVKQHRRHPCVRRSCGRSRGTRRRSPRRW